MTQLWTVLLTIFYVGWLCFIAFILYRLTTAAQKIATGIYQIAQRNADDHLPH